MTEYSRLCVAATAVVSALGNIDGRLARGQDTGVQATAPEGMGSDTAPAGPERADRGWTCIVVDRRGDDLPRLAYPGGDDGSILDVMVVYTFQARHEAGGFAAIEQLILDAVAETNAAYANSMILPRLALVHSEEVDYDETGTMEDHLDRLRDPADGVMDEVHYQRNAQRADLVCLLVSSPEGSVAGIADLGGTFSVIGQNYALAPDFVFAHELGHSQGCAHDRDNACSELPCDGCCCPSDPRRGMRQGAFPYSYAYRFFGQSQQQWATIVAGGIFGDGRIQHFSNPDVLFDGAPTGVPGAGCDSANNAATINGTAFEVANRRTAEDCNGNGVLDGQDIADGTSPDCDGNGIPDECQPFQDCNGNGMQDFCDVALGISPDCDQSGTPDECDTLSSLHVGSPNLSDMGAFGSGYAQFYPITDAPLAAGQVTLAFTCRGDLGDQDEFVLIELNGTLVGLVFENGADDCHPIGNTDEIVVPGPLFNSLIDPVTGDVVIGMISNGSPFQCSDSFIAVEVDYQIVPVAEDCNTNGVPDACDLASGSSEDSDSNGVPDECEGPLSIYVTDHVQNGRIYELDPDDALNATRVVTFAAHTQQDPLQPSGISRGPGQDLFVINDAILKMMRYDPVTGSGEIFLAPMCFEADVAIGPDNELYISREVGHPDGPSIQKVDFVTGGQTVFTLWPGEFAAFSPTAMVFGGFNQNLFVGVTHDGNDAILEFDRRSGAFLASVTEGLPPADVPDGPRAMKIRRDGNDYYLLVACSHANSESGRPVQQYLLSSTAGSPLQWVRSFGQPLACATSLEFSTDGSKLIAGDHCAYKLVEFDWDTGLAGHIRCLNSAFCAQAIPRHMTLGRSSDLDGDGVRSVDDNCPFIFNPEQEDGDSNGVGDACECPWDLDGDGTVNTADLLALLGAWGTSGGDIDGDGTTSTADLLSLLANWGVRCP